MENLNAFGGPLLFEDAMGKERTKIVRSRESKIILMGIPKNIFWKVPICSKTLIWQIALVTVKGHAVIWPMSSVCMLTIPPVETETNAKVTKM
ncbi:MAG: hypothetical protein A3B11_00940 [Candidatus Taylorbacteria bacterium RIFCSPLOWO2_01_FULL_44_26]|uniref:Uncharacterized protein n=2 Tax=Parcubacteria group TaxID=1794811 RepID=A0A1G2N8E6_9BACT|nr:MAG: hypothetical protein A2647_01215 [Candidatus Nomurabacteria bacterium RIFCSPHIGHO2_01_FULL_40_24b]OHA31511.1 MAG: hypothetical protein A3B11_00940 [Candidatus Taylorbacteria bacterium RIFCSPLOWO2_01_FULL_44_26]